MPPPTQRMRRRSARTRHRALVLLPLIAAGMSDAEIARIMRVPTTTVVSRVTLLRSLFGARNRAQLVAGAVASNVLAIRPDGSAVLTNRGS